MPRLSIRKFGGVMPRYDSQLLKENMASVAINVNLSRGLLEPFREPLKLLDMHEMDCIKTLYKNKNCCWVSFDKPCVSCTEWLPDCNKLFLNGVESYPQVMIINDKCENTCKRLGVPFSVLPPKVVYGENPKAFGNEKQIETYRAYVFTYVNSFGEEGAPSSSSELQNVVDGVSATITLPSTEALINDAWDIEKIRIYRVASDIVNKDDNSASDYLFVDEIPITQAVYEDTKMNDELMEALNSYEYTPPPEGLTNITSMPDGVLVGSVNNEVWFSEPYQPHAWPVDYMLSLDDKVLSLVYSSGVLYALTDGHPYAIDDKFHEETKQRQVMRISKPAPIASNKSAVPMMDGVVYASNDGLIYLNKSNLSVISLAYFNKEGWQELLPTTMIGAICDGKYIGVSAKNTILFDFKNDKDGIGDNELVYLSLRPNAMFSDRDGKLYMAFGNGVYEWDAGVNYLPYTWKSKSIHFDGLVNLSTSKIMFSQYQYPKECGGVSVKHYSDGRLILSRNVNKSVAYRLPSNSRYMDYEVEVSGTESIRAIELATSMKEIAVT